MAQIKYLTTRQLSDRWGGSPTPQTLKNWRNTGRGIPFIKLGRLVKYRLSDVLKYEKELDRSRRR